MQNLPYLTGESRLQSILAEKDNVKIIYSTVVDSIISEGGEFRGLLLCNTESGEREKLLVDGVFVAIGQVPENEPFKNILALNDYGYIIAGESCVPEGAKSGIFAAGDCRTKAVRQITTATADGATAALAAIRFLEK